MAVPSGGFEINLDVARDWQIVFELDDGSAKVWARFAIQETGMQHAQSPSVHKPELIPIQALMTPNSLKQALGRLGEFAQNPTGMRAAPLRIK